MKQKIIIFSLIVVLILGITCGYVIYKNVDNSKVGEKENEQKIVVNSIEKILSKEDYDKINSILDNLTYRFETIDAIVTDYLVIDGKNYHIQKDSKGIVCDNKQGDITKKDFDILYEIIVN